MLVEHGDEAVVDVLERWAVPRSEYPDVATALRMLRS